MDSERPAGRHRSRRPVILTVVVTVVGLLAAAIISATGARLFDWTTELGQKPFDVTLKYPESGPLIKGAWTPGAEARAAYCGGMPHDTPPDFLPAQQAIDVTLLGKSKSAVVLQEVRPVIIRADELSNDYHSLGAQCGDYFDPAEVMFDFADPRKVTYSRSGESADPGGVEEMRDLSLSLQQGEGSGFWVWGRFSERRNVSITWDLIVMYSTEGKRLEANLNELSGHGHFVSSFACGSAMKNAGATWEDVDPFSNPIYTGCAERAGRAE